MYRTHTSTLMMSLLLSALCAPSAQAKDVKPPAANADTAASYGYVQALRYEAQNLSEPKEASQDDLKRAVAEYQQALDYLATPPVAERASGDTWLAAESMNVRFSMAMAYARLGMKEQALAALEKISTDAWLPPAFLSLPALDGLRDEPRFKALLRTWALPERLYKVPAIATPYKPVLSVEEKVAGLSLFWAEARRNFVHFDHVPDLAWDQVYMDYLSKVIAAPTTRDYYLIMTQLAPLLQDGHTNIYMPKELQSEFYAAPSMRTALVEDKVLVEYVGNEALGARVHAGDEIVAIDGEPARQYADKRVTPFVSASTPQDRTMRTYDYQLLAGDAKKPVTLRLRDAGVERTEVVERGGSNQGRPQFQFKMLLGEIAYISIDHFENPKGVKAFEVALPQILKAKGLLIDVRRNGGGSTNYGLSILSYLSRQPIVTTVGYVRSDDAYVRSSHGPAINWKLASGGQKFSAAHPEVYTGPVAVLTGPRTFSAAEDFTAAFKLMKRGIIVGEATGGSTGQPLAFDLPGGGKARICIKRDLYPDGSSFIGTGILPDVEAHQTVAGLRAGQDPVLERAIAALGQQSALGQQ